MKVFLRLVAAFAVILGCSATLPLFWRSASTAAAGVPEPLSDNPVEQGAPFVAVIGLSSPPTATSASVTGPFLIAIQTNYAYGSIDGIHFGTTASTDGQCNQTPDYGGCTAYLLIELLPSAAAGLDYGTVTFSNGSSLQVVSNVRAPGFTVSPNNFGAYTLAGDAGDPLLIFLTNTTSAAVSMGKPSFIDELNSGAASYFVFESGCGNSLAAGATCMVSFSPPGNRGIDGYIQLPTGLGPIELPLSAGDISTPANLQINPQYLDFPVGADGSSAVRTITIKNAGQVAESITIPGAGPSCYPVFDGPCLNIVSNDCATIAAHGTCEIQADFLVDPSQAFTGLVQGTLTFSVEPHTGPGAGTYSIGYSAYPSPGPPSPAVIAASPAALQFPATPFGEPSDPKSLTVTNVSSRTLSIALPSVTDFIADPSCPQLLPGASCEVLVRYVPMSGTQQAAQSLVITATDVADPTGLTLIQSQQIIAATGSSIPQASLASPFGGIVAPYVFDSGVNLNVTNVASVPLVFSSISGNRNYYAGEALVVDTTGCGATLAPGKTCSLAVSAHKCDEDFEPACFLTIASNALSSPDVYSFEGNQTADIHSVLTVDSGPIVFGQTPTGSKSASQIVHITLTNANASVSVPFNVLPVVDSDFTIDNQCPKVLVPVADNKQFSTSCAIVVTFVPQSEGFHVGALTYRSSLQGDTLSLAGTGSAPALKIEPASLRFVSTAVGSSSASQLVTVTNPGSAAVTIDSVSLVGGQADDYAVTNACGASLAAAANCSLSVTFKPVSAGTKLARITIADDAGGSPQSVSLSGIGTSNASPLSIQCPTSTARFGVAYDSSLVATGGVPPYAFSIAQGALPNGLGLNFNTGAITGTPTAAAKYAFEIQVTDASQNLNDKATQACSITVTPPAAPALTATPYSLSFGTVEHYSSQIKEVTLRNTSTVPIKLWHAIVTPAAGTGAHDFSAIDRCDTTLPSGASCTIYIVFVSEQAGSLSARLSVPNSARQPLEIGLSASVTNGASASSSH